MSFETIALTCGCGAGLQFFDSPMTSWVGCYECGQRYIRDGKGHWIADKKYEPDTIKIARPKGWLERKGEESKFPPFDANATYDGEPMEGRLTYLGKTKVILKAGETYYLGNDGKIFTHAIVDEWKLIKEKENEMRLFLCAAYDTETGNILVEPVAFTGLSAGKAKEQFIINNAEKLKGVVNVEIAVAHVEKFI